MKTFTIDHQNRIVAHASGVPPSESRPEADVFSSEAELRTLARGWPLARLLAAWNNVPGVTAVHKFTDRETAVRRLWKLVQSLEPTTMGPTDQSTQRSSSRHAGRGNTKKAHVVELLRRPQGATIQEIMTETQWQNHTVRGFLSGTIHKRMGLAVAAQKRDDGARAYRIQETTLAGGEQ